MVREDGVHQLIHLVAQVRDLLGVRNGPWIVIKRVGLAISKGRIDITKAQIAEETDDVARLVWLIRLLHNSSIRSKVVSDPGFVQEGLVSDRFVVISNINSVIDSDSIGIEISKACDVVNPLFWNAVGDPRFDVCGWSALFIWTANAKISG